MEDEILYPGSRVRIDNDHWDDQGEYTVKEVHFRPNSTGVLIHLVDQNNNQVHRVVPYNQFYKGN